MIILVQIFWVSTSQAILLNYFRITFIVAEDLLLLTLSKYTPLLKADKSISDSAWLDLNVLVDSFFPLISNNSIFPFSLSKPESWIDAFAKVGFG